MTVALTILFLLSLALLLVRVYEIGAKKLTPISSVIRKLDPAILACYEYSKFLVSRFSAFALESKIYSIAFLKRTSAYMISWIKHRIDIIHDRLNGKGKIKERGSVSFFLKSISEHKEAMRKENGE